jgi:hypothetical protein
MHTGQLVTVFHEPMFDVDVEGKGTVIEVLGKEKKKNIFGETLYRLRVKFPNDPEIHERIVSDYPTQFDCYEEAAQSESDGLSRE